MTDRAERFDRGMARHCDRTVDIAAYLSGELSSAEELDLRAHADLCDACGPELTLMRSLVDRVRSVRPEDLDEQHDWELSHNVGVGLFERALQDPADGPSIAVAGTSRSARTGRRSRRTLVTAAVAAGVGLLAGAGSVVGVQAALKKDPENVGERVTLSLVSTAGMGAAPVKAWAWIGPAPAGTYAVLYTQGLPPNQVYEMWFETADGKRMEFGSFRSTADGKLWLKCPGSTALDRADIVAIGASSPGGDVLRADLRSGALKPTGHA